MATKLTQAYIETTDTAKKAQMESCLESVNTWLPKLWEKYVPCRDKRKADNTKCSECNGKQSTFESAFCSYISKLEDACDTQDTCRKHSLAARTNTIKRVQDSVKNRKADYQAGTMVMCYFKIFEAKSDADKTKMLEECKPKMKSPRCDVYMNVTGQKISPATKPAEIIPMLGDQICKCVQWEPSMREMIKDGITEFYECGPMKQLKAMMKRIDPATFKSTVTIDV